nr:hypothetical protein [Tanacetum cinerariifolium]
MPNLRPYFEPKPKPTTTLNPSLVIHQIGRTLWSLEIRMDIHGLVHQPDVKNSFLSGDLSETVYMHQPLGFVDPRYPHHVCLLQRRLGISVTRDTIGMLLSQKKYVIELFKRAHMLKYNPTWTFVDLESKLGPEGTPILDPTLYRRSSLVAYSDADWAGYSATCRSTSGYCVFMGNNILSWSAKRQHTLSCFSAEAEYQGVANVVAETAWLRNLL